MADILFRDEDVIIQDEDVLFDEHELKLLVVSEGTQINAADGDGVFLVEHVLALSDCVQENHAENVDIGGTLSPASTIQLNAVETPTLEQEHNLSVSDTESSNVVDVPTLTYLSESSGSEDSAFVDTLDSLFQDTDDAVWYPHYLSELDVSDCVQENHADAVALIGEGLLAISAGTQIQTVASVTLTEHISETLLVPSDGIQVNEVDALALVQEHNQTVADSEHINAAESFDLEQEHTLAVDSGTQVNATETLLLAVEGVDYVAIDDSHIANVAESPTLTIEHALAVSNSDIVNTGEEVTLESDALLVVAGAYTAQDAEAVQLSEEQNLVVSDTAQTQAQDLPEFEQEHRLGVAVSDSDIIQTADSVVLTEESGDTLTISDSVNQNFVDALILIQEHVASNLDSAQVNAADTVNLSVELSLLLQDSVVAQYVQALNLAYSASALGFVVNPYLISLTQRRELISSTPNRYLVQ